MDTEAIWIDGRAVDVAALTPGQLSALKRHVIARAHAERAKAIRAFLAAARSWVGRRLAGAGRSGCLPPAERPI